MKTRICDLLGIDIPIIQAPMGGAVGPRLAAAVSNAGALGTLPLWTDEPNDVRSNIREMRSLTSKPFAVNLNMEFPQEERLEICLEENVPIISFFWQDPSSLVGRAKDGGAIVMHTVGNAVDAVRAVDCGVDIIVAQGWEAGGHVRGMVATMALVPAIVDAVGDVPVIAAGGIADGRGMAAALALGAAGVWIGTRFLASEEVEVHPHYQERILSASEDDTVYLDDLFDIGWPNAPHRVLRTDTVSNWEYAGCPPPGKRPGEGNVIAKDRFGNDIVMYRAFTPRSGAEGDIEALSMWAGQSCGMVQSIQPAETIVREIADSAEAILRNLSK